MPTAESLNNSRLLPAGFSCLVGPGIFLLHQESLPPDLGYGRVLLHRFSIHRQEDERRIGLIDLRAGNTEHIVKYAGHLGYCVRPPYRGHGYAGLACEAIAPLARYHGFDHLWITCNPDNFASRRTCEKLGATWIETLPLPPDNDLFTRGERWKCRYRWEISNCAKNHCLD